MIATAAQPVSLRRVPLESSLGPQDVLRMLQDEAWPFALTGNWAGGGAIVGSDPLIVADPRADPFSLLSAALPVQAGEPRPGVVGGGWFGWLGYRLGGRIEQVPPARARPVALPDFHLAYYDHVLHLDGEGQWWFEALAGSARERALERRLSELRAILAVPALASRQPYVPPDPLVLAREARSEHLRAVGECRERIVAGEIFQANICLRLETRWGGNPLALFAQARERVEPPYGAAFRTPWGGIASLSPELFLQRRGREVVTAPIKGTIARDRDPEAALAALRGSGKDAAEHVMIVDLMRNDLGRVCEYGSIRALGVEAEAHPGVWHLVSRVRGRLRADSGDGELLRATFPPGSVTGAPKVQAMRVIAELEPAGREVYTGAIGFASPLAGLEWSVAIRTFELCRGRLWLGAGGGIVAESDPERELEEALLKARPLAAAIGSSVRVD